MSKINQLLSEYGQLNLCKRDSLVCCLEWKALIAGRKLDIVGLFPKGDGRQKVDIIIYNIMSGILRRDSQSPFSKVEKSKARGHKFKA